MDIKDYDRNKLARNIADGINGLSLLVLLIAWYNDLVVPMVAAVLAFLILIGAGTRWMALRKDV